MFCSFLLFAECLQCVLQKFTEDQDSSLYIKTYYLNQYYIFPDKKVYKVYIFFRVFYF